MPMSLIPAVVSEDPRSKKQSSSQDLPHLPGVGGRAAFPAQSKGQRGRLKSSSMPFLAPLLQGAGDRLASPSNQSSSQSKTKCRSVPFCSLDCVVQVGGLQHLHRKICPGHLPECGSCPSEAIFRLVQVTVLGTPTSGPAFRAWLTPAACRPSRRTHPCCALGGLFRLLRPSATGERGRRLASCC